MAEKKILRVDEVAERLSCGKRTVYNLIESGELAAMRLGRTKGLRVSAEAVSHFLSRRFRAFREENDF